MAIKYVYIFAKGDADGRGDMKDLLGGKGAGLAEMTNAGLPVPPGFTITTEACNAYYESGAKFPAGMWEEVLDSLRKVERASGKKFGDVSNPVLVSVRAGAKFSMPGMMDTVLNLGLNDQSVKGLADQTDDERFAYDSYRRFVSMFGRIVLGIEGSEFDGPFDGARQRAGVASDAEVPAGVLADLVEEYKAIVERRTGSPFP